jgi:murein L,D-transpeptidase YcbB/YkuD
MQVIRESSRTGRRASAPIRAVVLFLLLAFSDLPAAAQDDASALGEILSAGAPPITDIDAALGAEALADLKQVYAARNDRPIWLGSAAGHDLLDRLAQPDVTIGPKLGPLLEDARRRIDAADAFTRAGADLLLTALYGATAQALRPSAPAGFSAAIAELATTADVASLLHEPEPPKIEPAPLTPAAPAVAAPAAASSAPEPPAGNAQKIDEPAPVPDGPKLQLGDSGPRVEALSRNLIAWHDLKAETPSRTFDAALKSALEHFQARHGLPADGVAGEATIAALNVPAAKRAANLAGNIARGAKRNWGDRYLVVNIAAATYRLVDGGRTVVEGPAILGAPSTPTPPIDAVVDRVELWPSYRIPQSVADRQLWPRQEEDALYFTNHGIRVTDEGLRQLPGAGNPLGAAKLLIAGNDRIALHGTPAGVQSQAAFEAPGRHASLGCVVLPNIADVVKPLLAADPAWTEGRIAGALAAGGTETVTLAQPLPLHFVYETAWVDADGTQEFRDDVYGWDQQMPSTDVNTVVEPCGS